MDPADSRSQHPDRMKITDVTLTLFAWDDIPATSYGAHTGRFSGQTRLGLLALVTDQGITGHAFLGSAFYAADMDGASLIRSLKPLLMGQNPLDRERLGKAMWKRVRTTTVRSIGAVDIALWDIAGKMAGLPVHACSAPIAIACRRTSVPRCCRPRRPMPRRRCPTSRATWLPTRSIRRRSGGRHQGMRGRAPGGRRRLPLMLDATWSYDYAAALRVGRAIQDLDYYWYEDPLADNDIYNYVELRKKLHIPIMATEYPAGGLDSYTPWIMERATDFLRGDVAVKGGITTLMKAAHLAEAFHLNFEVHHGGNSLNNVANLHVIMALQNTEFFEVLLPDGVAEIRPGGRTSKSTATAWCTRRPAGLGARDRLRADRAQEGGGAGLQAPSSVCRSCAAFSRRGRRCPSQTRSGRTASHDETLPALQRLCAPRRAIGVVVGRVGPVAGPACRADRAPLRVWPSHRPGRHLRSAAASPSAAARSRVIGVRCSGGATWPSSRSSRDAASAWGNSMVERPPAASRSNATKDGRVCLRQPGHAGRGGMQPHLQRVEVEALAVGDDDLAVEHAAAEAPRPGPVPAPGNSGSAGLDRGSAGRPPRAVAKDERPKAVPFGFEQEAESCCGIAHPRSSRAWVRWAGRGGGGHAVFESCDFCVTPASAAATGTPPL